MSDFDIFRSFWHIGGNLNIVLYGLELVLYYHTLKFALDARTRHKRAYANGPVGDDANCSTILTLSTALLVMMTIYIFTQSSLGEVTWVIDINDIGYPGGGSGQCAADYTAVWYRVAGSTVSVVMNWVVGPYLIHRVTAVWGGRSNVTIVPTMLYEGTLVLGIPMCYYGGPLGGGFFVDTVAPRIAMGYSVVAALMNVICTFLICGRILYVSGAFSVFLNGGTPDDLSSRRSTQGSRIFLYRLAAMMVVDSMLPHTLFGAAYVLALALGSPVYILFLSLYVMFTCLSPQMLMLRVVMGCEWRADRVHPDEQSSSLQFSGFTKPQIDTRTFHPHKQPGH